MNTLARLHDLQLGSPISVGNLTLFPLLAPEVANATYLTLDEAIAEHFAQVTEISEEGSVGQL